jgi:hypothetical protein
MAGAPCPIEVMKEVAAKMNMGEITIANVYPREIEEFLYAHPEIQDVQVIGVPD